MDRPVTYRTARRSLSARAWRHATKNGDEPSSKEPHVIFLALMVRNIPATRAGRQCLKTPLVSYCGRVLVMGESVLCRDVGFWFLFGSNAASVLGGRNSFHQDDRLWQIYPIAT